MGLGAEQRSHFDLEGYLFFPSLFSPEVKRPEYTAHREVAPIGCLPDAVHFGKLAA
jgi:hypothetical protein